MDWSEFARRFGGSARTRYVRPPLRRPLKALRRRGLRRCAWPKASELPKEFIRLCPWEAEYLFRVASGAKVGILETGRCFGGSTFLLAAAAPGVPIWSIDLAPKDDAALRAHFARTGVGSNVALIVGDSQHASHPQVGSVDVVFIDGDHTYEGAKADIENWYDHVVPGGHLVFHDAYAGRLGVQAAIKDFLRQRGDLTVVLSPDIGERFWTLPYGSLCHLTKASVVPAPGTSAAPRDAPQARPRVTT